MSDPCICGVGNNYTGEHHSEYCGRLKDYRITELEADRDKMNAAVDWLLAARWQICAGTEINRHLDALDELRQTAQPEEVK